DRASLADGAIDRADQRRIAELAAAGLEGAREEVVEALVMADVAFQRLGHVDLVLGHEAANDPGGDPAPLLAGDPACEGVECLLGVQVLEEDEEAFRHRYGAMEFGAKGG